MVYDVDGESSQSEKVSGYFADGLFGYRIGTVANSVTAAYTSVGGNGMIFSGAGTNLPETSVGGAAILYYQNTNTLTLRFDANTNSGASGSSPNGVFSGIDGDLSMLGAGASGGTADYTGFTAFIPVPEPSSGLLAILPLAGFLLIMRRRS